MGVCFFLKKQFYSNYLFFYTQDKARFMIVCNTMLFVCVFGCFLYVQRVLHQFIELFVEIFTTIMSCCYLVCNTNDVLLDKFYFLSILYI